jgi:hypothetical protein
MVKYGSRKFLALCIQSAALVVLPIVYKKLEISDEILMVVLGSGSALVAAYTGFNVLQKKINPDE